MITVQLQKEIDYPPRETFKFIANPENNPIWQKGMKKCSIISSGVWGLHSEYQQEAEFMGKPVITTFRITEFQDHHYIKGESIISTFPITFKRSVQEHEGKTLVQAVITGDPAGFLKWFPFLTKWMIRSTITKDYEVLKEYLENRKATSG